MLCYWIRDCCRSRISTEVLPWLRRLHWLNNTAAICRSLEWLTATWLSFRLEILQKWLNNSCRWWVAPRSVPSISKKSLCMCKNTRAGMIDFKFVKFIEPGWRTPTLIKKWHQCNTPLLQFQAEDRHSMWRRTKVGVYLKLWMLKIWLCTQKLCLKSKFIFCFTTPLWLSSLPRMMINSTFNLLFLEVVTSPCLVYYALDVCLMDLFQQIHTHFYDKFPVTWLSNVRSPT